MYYPRFARRLLLVASVGYALLLAAAPLGTAAALPTARCCRSHSGGHASYGGGHHSGSHGGHYSGGHGSSHKGGHYRSPSGGTHYGRHRP